MVRTIKYLILFAALLSVTAMSSCGKKSDFDLSLDEGAYSDTEETPGSEGSMSQSDGSQESGDAGIQIPGDDTNAADTQADDGPVFVHICGAVKDPDVYEVSHDARVIDVIRLAGGFTDEADSDYHNLAGGVSDGQKIYVPTEQEVADGLVPAPELNSIYAKETAQGGGSAQDAAQISDGSGKVNINTATLEELKTLNGIGDKRAQDIIDYRTSKGGFKTIDDIKNVNGIKDGIFVKICDDITV